MISRTIPKGALNADPEPSLENSTPNGNMGEQLNRIRDYLNHLKTVEGRLENIAMSLGAINPVPETAQDQIREEPTNRIQLAHMLANDLDYSIAGLEHLITEIENAL